MLFKPLSNGVGYKSLFLSVLLLVPVFFALQTLHRFLLWETVNGTLTKTVSSGSGYRSGRYFIVEFIVEKQVYTVNSTIGTNDTSSDFTDNSEIEILYDPDDPSSATIKYRHGQLEKLIFIVFLFGGFWVVTRISLMAFEDIQAKNRRMKKALPQNLVDIKPEFAGMIESNDKVGAIKYLRQTYSLSLKDAKSEVDRYLQ